MELKTTRTYLTLPSSLLAIALTLGACGDETKSTGDDDAPSDEDGSSGERDAGTKPTDSGQKPADAGAKPADSGGSGKDAGSGSKPDASDDETPSGQTGNTIYTGGPECPNIGRKISGTVDGHEISYNLPTMSEGDETSFQADDPEADTGLLRLEWEPAIDSSGKPATIVEGELELPTTLDFGPYCVLAGKAQRDSKLSEDDGFREFYTITKVRAKPGTECTGPELEADLKVCTNYR
jgi:hypothetical protein